MAKVGKTEERYSRDISKALLCALSKGISVGILEIETVANRYRPVVEKEGKTRELEKSVLIYKLSAAAARDSTPSIVIEKFNNLVHSELFEKDEIVYHAKVAMGICRQLQSEDLEKYHGMLCESVKNLFHDQRSYEQFKQDIWRVAQSNKR